MPRTKGKLTHEQIVELYKDHSVNQIAALDGTSYVAILKILHRLDVRMRPRGNNAVRIPHITHGYCQAAKRLGMTTYRYVRLRAIQQLGGVCSMCGETDLAVLDINHINGENAPQKQNGVQTNLKYKEHLKILSGEPLPYIEVLCCNCNRRHEIIRGNIPAIPEEFYADTGPNRDFQHCQDGGG